MAALREKVIPLGGFWWQLMDGGGVKLNSGSVTPAQCKSTLQTLCVPNSTSWNKMQMYNVPKGGSGVTTQGFTDYTAEFLLTRGCVLHPRPFPHCAASPSH
jgi:hypothetical protein